jgi:hypothetical protein
LLQQLQEAQGQLGGQVHVQKQAPQQPALSADPRAARRAAAASATTHSGGGPMRGSGGSSGADERQYRPY